MPNASLIQQKDFAGGVNDLTPPDLLKDNECLEMVNFLPGGSGTPLPVRGGTAAVGTVIDEAPISGLFTFHRSDGEDFRLAVCDNHLYSVTP